MRFWQMIMVVCLAALVFSQTASAFVLTATAQSPQNIGLIAGQSLSVPIKIENLDVDAHNVEISFDSNSNFIEANPAVEEMELSPQQAAEFGITFLATDDADNESYDVDIIVEADGQITVVPYTVHVGTNPYVTINTFSEDVCANEYVGNLSFSVKNLRSSSVEMEFIAEQSILLPSADPDSADFDAGETKFIDLQVNTQPANLGDYDGLILVKTPDIWAQKPFSVTVNDCPAPFEKPFEMTLPTNPKSLPRFKTTTIPVILKNLSEETQTITLAADGAIPSQSQTVQIPKNEQATIQMAFTPGISTPAGTYRTEFIASNGNYTQKKLLNLKVLPTDNLEIIANIPHFEVEKGKSITVSFRVRNNGDSSQTVNFGMQQSTPGINYIFTPATTVLGANQEVRVQLKVEALSATSVTSVSNKIIADGKSDAEYPLSFDVVRSTDEEEKTVLEFLSIPESIRIAQGETRQIEVVIFNNSDRSVSEIDFRMTGATAAGLDLQSDESIVLAPYEKRTIVLTLHAQNDAPVGVIIPSIIADSPRATGVFPLRVEIISGNAFGGFLTGFILFAGSNVIGLAVLLFLILLILGLWYNRHSQNQVWQEAHKSE